MYFIYINFYFPSIFRRTFYNKSKYTHIQFVIIFVWNLAENFFFTAGKWKSNNIYITHKHYKSSFGIWGWILKKLKMFYDKIFYISNNLKVNNIFFILYWNCTPWILKNISYIFIIFIKTRSSNLNMTEYISFTVSLSFSLSLSLYIYICVCAWTVSVKFWA